MSAYYFPFVLTVAGMLFYHIAQKSIPNDMNPFLVTILAYAVGITLCAAGALAYPSRKPLVESLKESNWAVVTLGAAAALIELGFLLAYRGGWRISVAAVATNAAATVMLIPIGVIIFRDHLSLRNFLGLAFCVVCLVLIMRD
jgi:uncharacterized membrane protein